MFISWETLDCGVLFLYCLWFGIKIIIALYEWIWILFWIEMNWKVFSLFWKRLCKNGVNSLNFDRIIQLNPLGLKIYLLCVYILKLESVFLIIYLNHIFHFEWVVVACISRNWSTSSKPSNLSMLVFLLCSLITLLMSAWSVVIPYFIPDTGNLSLLFFVSLSKGFTVLLIFSKSELLFHWFSLLFLCF